MAGFSSEKPVVELDANCLPVNPTAAYQLLFTYREANNLFAPVANASPRSYVSRLRQQQGEAKADPKPRVLGERSL